MNANNLKNLRITEQHMAAFWERMEQIYGSKFTSEFGNAIDFWFRAFTERKLSAYHLKQGLEACMDGGEQFPPSLPKFLAMCKPKKHEAHVEFEDKQPSLEQKHKEKQLAMAQLHRFEEMVKKHKALPQAE